MQRLRPWIIAVGGALIAVAVVGVMFFTPLLRVDEVEVVGAENLDSAEVAEIAGARGLHILGVDVDDVANSVAAMPRVDSVSVTRSFPAHLTVHVAERDPVAVLVPMPLETDASQAPEDGAAADDAPEDEASSARGTPALVASDGVVLAKLDPSEVQATGVPVIAVDHEPPAVGSRWQDADGEAQLAALGDLPDALLARLESAAVGDRGVEAEVADGPHIVFGTAHDMAQKAIVLEDVLADAARRSLELEYVDLTSPAAPAIKRS